MVSIQLLCEPSRAPMGEGSDGEVSSTRPGLRDALAHVSPEAFDSGQFGAGQFGWQSWAILERIARGAALSELLQSIVALVEQQGESMLCSILLLDPDGRHLRHGAALRFPKELSLLIDGLLIGLTAGSCGAAAFRREGVVVTDIGTHPNWSAYRAPFLAHGICACWSSPIFSPGGDVLGTLAMYFRERRGPSLAERECVAVATHLSAIALARAQAEREHQRLLYALGERVKELTLLHRSARLLQARERPPRELLAEFVQLLPGGWQYPEICEARIVWGALELQTPGYVDSPWKQSAARKAGEHALRVEVVYSREMPCAAEGPFLLEERHLIQSLADLCAAYLDRHLAEQALQNSLFELRAANQRLELQVTQMQLAEAERAALEAQLRHAQRIQALGTLAGGIAHDFNNILTAITGHTFLALADLEDVGSTQDSLLAIQEASLRAVELVRRILTFSRHREPERVLASVGPIVKEALSLLSATLPASISIQTRFAPQTPALHVDAAQLHQVIMNLGTNAAYALGGSGVIDVAVEPVPASHEDLRRLADPRITGYVRVSVSDRGTGMSEATLERIFEPFFTTKPPGQGTGLGLSVVHGIIKAHGGVIAVQSQLGQGSVFRVYLPESSHAAADLPGIELKDALPPEAKALHPASAEAAPRAAGQVGDVARSADSAASGAAGGLRVLYVDDEEPLVMLAQRWLSRLGHRVTGFSDPALALESFREHPDDFDAVISDLSMPGLSGLDLVRQILMIRPHIFVLLSSGYVRPEDQEAAHALGAVDVIPKPQSMAEFGQVLHRILQQRLAPV
jgi:signal transduction histidine kinase/CheY-like chemotaxis protein